jgi:hypothetical protein
VGKSDENGRISMPIPKEALTFCFDLLISHGQGQGVWSATSDMASAFWGDNKFGNRESNP